MPDTTLDLRGLRCPLPALKTRKALTRLAAGERLVRTKGFRGPGFSLTGDVLEDQTTEPGLFVFRILKKGA